MKECFVGTNNNNFCEMVIKKMKCRIRAAVKAKVPAKQKKKLLKQKLRSSEAHGLNFTNSMECKYKGYLNYVPVVKKRGI